MTFEETLNLLDEWRGRQVSAAVRSAADEDPAQVAVFRGRLGKVQPQPRRSDGDSEVFFPVGVKGDGSGLDDALGLHFDEADFEDARSEPDRLYLQLKGAMVEVAPQ